MIHKFAPMLAAKCVDVNKLKYPLLGTPKIDGIRCLTMQPLVMFSEHHLSDPVTRNLNRVPNEFIASKLTTDLMPGFDGELTVGDNFNKSSSGIMSRDGFPDFKYYVFDYGHHLIAAGHKDPGYQGRVEVLAKLHLPDYVVKVLPVTIPTPEHLAAYEAACLSEGYEGVMVRTADSPYKFGRSTFKEGWLVKIKRFEDSEAEVLEVIEQYTNNNAPEQDKLGHQVRSTSQAGLTPAGVMGALRVRDIKTGVEFQVGTGFDDLQRTSIWTFRSTYIGALLKYKHQPHGKVDAPRFPVFVGWRDQRDL